MRASILILLLSTLLFSTEPVNNDGGGLGFIKTTFSKVDNFFQEVFHQRDENQKKIEQIRKKLQVATSTAKKMRVKLEKANSLASYAKNAKKQCESNYTEKIDTLQKVSQKEHWSKEAFNENMKKIDNDLDICITQAGNLKLIIVKLKKVLFNAQNILRKLGYSTELLKVELRQAEEELKRLNEAIESTRE